MTAHQLALYTREVNALKTVHPDCTMLAGSWCKHCGAVDVEFTNAKGEVVGDYTIYIR